MLLYQRHKYIQKEKETRFLIIINEITTTCSLKWHHNTETVFCNTALFSRIVFTIKAILHFSTSVGAVIKITTSQELHVYSSNYLLLCRAQRYSSNYIFKIKNRLSLQSLSSIYHWPLYIGLFPISAYIMLEKGE